MLGERFLSFQEEHAIDGQLLSGVPGKHLKNEQ